MSRFPDGSIVRLKSGGPNMLCRFTVEPESIRWWSIGSPYYGCVCRWFDANGHLHDGCFAPDDLETAGLHRN
jgi:uncharacterized protein YodC (DUF2158 family)